MNKLLRVAETLPAATPFSPSNDSSLRSTDPSAPLSQCRAPSGGGGWRAEVGNAPGPAGPGCPQAAGFAARHWLCPAAAPACHSFTWHNSMAIKACTKGCFFIPQGNIISLGAGRRGTEIRERLWLKAPTRSSLPLEPSIRAYPC